MIQFIREYFKLMVPMYLGYILGSALCSVFMNIPFVSFNDVYGLIFIQIIGLIFFNLFKKEDYS